MIKNILITVLTIGLVGMSYIALTIPPPLTCDDIVINKYTPPDHYICEVELINRGHGYEVLNNGRKAQ